MEYFSQSVLRIQIEFIALSDLRPSLVCMFRTVVCMLRNAQKLRYETTEVLAQSSTERHQRHLLVFVQTLFIPFENQI